MKNVIYTLRRFHLTAILLLTVYTAFGQNNLQTTFKQIADSLNGNLGVSALLIETGESISYQGDKKFPMQSVYKFPIAMVMLHHIDANKFSLEDTIKIDKAEYIPMAGHSPLRDKYPNGSHLTIDNILAYNVAQSDGTACDVLLRLLGGTQKVNEHIHVLEYKLGESV